MAETLVELTHSRAVLVRGGREVVRLDRQRIDLPEEMVERARGELLRRDSRVEPGHRFGYLLGVEEGSVAAPAAEALVERLRRDLVDPIGACRGVGFGLSFLKALEGTPPRSEEGPLHDGFHLDTHPDLVRDGGPELLRVLVNLDSEPRTLRMIAAERFALAGAGLDLPRSSFQVVAEPLGFATLEVEIPPMAGGEVSCLTFWASVVPHVGIEQGRGHFLASFEATADYR